MGKKSEGVVGRLQHLGVRLAQAREQAEARVDEVDRYVGSLAGGGQWEGLVVIGPAVRPSEARGEGEPAYYPALVVPAGFGVAWRAGATEQPEEEGKPPTGAAMAFAPFAGCDRGLRTVLLPHLEPMVLRLIQMIG